MNIVDKIQKTLNFTDYDTFSFPLCFKGMIRFCCYGLKIVKTEIINFRSVG
jgi:hypothetical protein